MKGWQFKIVLEIGINVIEDLSRMKMIDLMKIHNKWFKKDLLEITLFLHYRQIKGMKMRRKKKKLLSLK
jgi:hypothetical protein